MKRHFRLISFTQGLTIGDFQTIEEAWAAVKNSTFEYKGERLKSGRMILWEQWETAPGDWMWRQRALKFIPWHGRLAFWAKNKWKAIRERAVQLWLRRR